MDVFSQVATMSLLRVVVALVTASLRVSRRECALESAMGTVPMASDGLAAQPAWASAGRRALVVPGGGRAAGQDTVELAAGADAWARLRPTASSANVDSPWILGVRPVISRTAVVSPQRPAQVMWPLAVLDEVRASRAVS
jgi:hypothetical protein